MNERIDISNGSITELRAHFKTYLAKDHPELMHHDIICSEAFYPYRKNIGIEFFDIFQEDDGIARCRELLESHFEKIERKNPKSDSYVYCRAIKLLNEFLDMNQNKHNYKQELVVKSKRNSSNKVKPDIPEPSNEEVMAYIERWESLENYRQQEEALDKLFFSTYPKNEDISDVLIKVSALNDFYSTNIFSPYQVAKHIVMLQMDERLNNCESALVDDLSKVKMENGTIKKFYSFATKYCSHHRPLDYPIYDSFVDKVLRYFRDADQFALFGNNDLREYTSFKQILLQFRQYYQLEQFNLKEIDKYLWQLGKVFFPKNFTKKNR